MVTKKKYDSDDDTISDSDSSIDDKKDDDTDDEEYDTDEDIEDIDLEDEENEDQEEDITEEIVDSEIDIKVNENCLVSDDYDYSENDNRITIVKDEDRITKRKLTKYERVRILGTRTKQLASGALPLVKINDTKTVEEIAEIELQMNMIPLKIKRLLPNNRYEIWALHELNK